MSKTLIVGAVNPSLLAFKPRQVLLSHHNMTRKIDAVPIKSLPPIKSHTAAVDVDQTLDPGQKSLLHHALALYLERSGFSKTLKKFRSEAQIEKDTSGVFLLNLEDMCYKYLKKCNQADTTLDKQETMKVADDRIPESQEQPANKCKVKKKKETNVVSESHGNTDEKDQQESLHVESIKDSEGTEPSEGNTVLGDVGRKSKDKKKKKNKHKLESISDDVESNHIAVATNSGDANVSSVAPLEEKVVKSKSKRKKDGELKGDANVSSIAPLEEKVVKSKSKRKKDGELKGDEISNQILTGSLNGTLNENGGIPTLHDECNEKSKKRKRLASVEHDSQPADEEKTEDTKRRKMEGSEECNGDMQSKKDNASVEIDVNAATMGTSNQPDGQTNDNVEKSGGRFSSVKTKRKQSDGSAEPKTVHAFQRVKIDAVVFEDEKLADNSYWAKGGADSGYGAKAQEILGQVKGRGFRHEKTKKKRGTYRGGVIDLQSHSVKFNYSDDD